MGGLSTATALIAVLVLAPFSAWGISRLLLHRRRRQRQARAVRRRGYQYAWDLVMRRRRNLLTYRPEDDIDGPPGQRA